MNKFEQIKQLDQQTYMHTYAPYDVAFVEGHGMTLTDSEGKEYLDFLGGIAVNVLGHSHPIFVEALTKQAQKLSVVSNYFYTEERGKLAELLMEGTAMQKAFFCNSGAEANECAIKLARKYFYNNGQNKFRIVTARHSFHGRTLATVSATGQPKYSAPYAPLPDGFGDYVPFNDLFALEQALADPTVAALLVEPIQGEGGVIPATKEYLAACRALTKKHGQLLIFDEVQTGASRTGTFWAHTQFDVSPDILTTAKGIGGGFPIGACFATDEVASAFSPGDHGTTFGSSPLACAVAYAVVSRIKEKNFLRHVTQIGEYFKHELFALPRFAVQDVRGIGLLLGVELRPHIAAKDVVIKMLKRGFVINACGDNVLRFVPPLIVSSQEIDKMLKALLEVLNEYI